jgi:hypothetical protein
VTWTDATLSLCALTCWTKDGVGMSADALMCDGPGSRTTPMSKSASTLDKQIAFRTRARDSVGGTCGGRLTMVTPGVDRMQ